MNTLTRTSTPQEQSNGANRSSVSVKPLYRIQENEDAWGVTVQLPGVTKDAVDITSEEGQLVIRGRRSWNKPDSWTVLHRESVDADYELILAHDNVVDAERIHAELKEGILRVSLPKAEAIKPRKIAVS
ncbi:MAG TPA: Hsp20/alpha crystallin family protein [Opitutaceae bacterium]|nr:Hsp20/alpha crystallin family protein [Opitutaceae bacterium]